MVCANRTKEQERLYAQKAVALALQGLSANVIAARLPLTVSGVRKVLRREGFCCPRGQTVWIKVKEEG